MKVYVDGKLYDSKDMPIYVELEESMNDPEFSFENHEFEGLDEPTTWISHGKEVGKEAVELFFKNALIATGAIDPDKL